MGHERTMGEVKKIVGGMGMSATALLAYSALGPWCEAWECNQKQWELVAYLEWSLLVSAVLGLVYGISGLVGDGSHSLSENQGTIQFTWDVEDEA